MFEWFFTVILSYTVCISHFHDIVSPILNSEFRILVQSENIGLVSFFDMILHAHFYCLKIGWEQKKILKFWSLKLVKFCRELMQFINAQILRVSWAIIRIYRLIWNQTVKKSTKHYWLQLVYFINESFLNIYCILIWNDWV